MDSGEMRSSLKKREYVEPYRGYKRIKKIKISKKGAKKEGK